MDKQEQKRISKFLSLVLRHRPETINIELDEAGWVAVDDLLAAFNSHLNGRDILREQLQTVVAENDKQRFEFSDDGQRIRASQGHSLDVELGYDEIEPPDVLFHGTIADFLESIRKSGLEKRQRQHVHLSATIETASKVGQRRGKPVILEIDAKAMHEAGHFFFLSTNGVWLTDHVPAEFINSPGVK